MVGGVTDLLVKDQCDCHSNPMLPAKVDTGGWAHRRREFKRSSQGAGLDGITE